jgi:hypothetical protein
MVIFSRPCIVLQITRVEVAPWALEASKVLPLFLPRSGTSHRENPIRFSAQHRFWHPVYHHTLLIAHVTFQRLDASVASRSTA